MKMRKLLPMLALLLLAFPALGKTSRSQNPYPNELPHLKFYVKHLSPLRPYLSDSALVVKVFGSSQGTELEQWHLRPHFVGQRNTVNGRPWARDITGRLASVEIIPKVRVSMLGVKFPAAFTQSRGGVSEINVSCEIHADSFGLQYWLYAEDSAVGKKGDLMKIAYGPSKRVQRQIIGSSKPRPNKALQLTAR